MIFIIWTCPRSLSTLTERVVINMGFKTIHEPFSYPYYFGTDSVSSRYLDNKKDEINYIDVFNSIISSDNIVIKDMGTHFYQSKLMNDKKVINIMKSWKHIFLIRNPDFCIRSLYDMSFSEKTGWNYFDENEVGYKDLYELYKIFGGHILMSEDLIDDSENFIKKLSKILDVDYRYEFLKWEKLENNIPKDWELWKEWHVDALKSTKIIKKDTSFVKKEDDEIKYRPIYECINENKYYYFLLRNLRLSNQC